MRTTVEISDEQRARLLELAARRGEKGFSGLVREALEMYLAEIDRRHRLARRALSAIGSFDAEEAEELERSVERLRASWR